MSNLTEWIKYELYPALFHRIDIAFPEHNFRQHNGNWRSNTYLDGKPHKRPDKTIVSRNAPSIIMENGGEYLSIIDYVIRKERVEFIEAVKTLAGIAGVQLPNTRVYDAENYQRQRDRAILLEDLQNYFVYLLTGSEHKEPERDEIRDYLISGRGYTDEDIQTLGLGYAPSQERVFAYLSKRGYNQAQIDEAVPIATDSRIGTSHRLTIPYRSGGSIKGFKFRAIGNETPKYINSKGLDKSGGFFNLLGIKGDKDIVIVEGELDALHATIRGVANVVAAGGSSINPEQVRDAVKRGAKGFTLCFDTEPGKETQTAQSINSAINVLLEADIARIYVARLLDLGGGKTDADRLIKELGVDAFIGTINHAIPYYEHWLLTILHKYDEIKEKRGLVPKDIDNLLAEVVETASKIPDAIARDRYKNLFHVQAVAEKYGISEESISLTVDKLISTKDKEAQLKDFSKLLADVTQLKDKGEIDKALDTLERGIKEVKLKDKKTSFSQLSAILTEDDIKKHFSRHSESLDSGYKISGSPLLLPSGGLTGIAGATGHGKTDFLINMTLNSVLGNPDKDFYFFTYEMSQEAILVRFLNTFIDEDLERESNHRAIKNYFKRGDTQYISRDKQEYFTIKTHEFFRDIIGSGRLKVKGIDYYAPELNLALFELARSSRVGGYFIDYFQLLRLPKEGYKNYSRQEELKVICQDLNSTAKDLQLPIILGAQFNREVTTPFALHATNIGEAGDIERILDTLIGIWNTSKKMVDKDLNAAQKKEVSNMGLDTQGKLYTYILKSRETATDISELLDYNGKRGKISNKAIKKNFF